MSRSQVNFTDIQAYLEAIANNPQDVRDVDNASHGRFWRVSHAQFLAGMIPHQTCNGAPISIVDADPGKCSFYQALIGRSGFCLRGQMPKMGPFITDAGYRVTLADGQTLPGTQIDSNIVWWLTNGMPEL
jgi:hypothetical protein